MLDLYWKFAELGDYYLGRTLACLDPDSETFGVLPPHFTAGTENPHINEAMRLCFGPIIDTWCGTCAIEGVLLLFLASMVWHSEWLLEWIAKDSSHPFQLIPILQHLELLEELKKLVTIEPTERMKVATGVPRFTKLLKKVNKMGEVGEKTLEKMEEMSNRLPEMVKDAINTTAEEAGQVTVPMVMDILNGQLAKYQDHNGIKSNNPRMLTG